MHRKMSKKFYIIFTVVMTAAILQFTGCSKKYGDGLAELKEAEEVPGEKSEDKEEIQKEEIQKEEIQKEEIQKEEMQKEIREPVQEEKAEGSGMICVHVCGRVANPGVYMFPSGSRIYEAVDAAGGLSEDAAGEQLNQALQMEDGQQIYVPSREEAEQGIAGGQGTISSTAVPAAAGGVETGDGKISLNTASKEQLMTLNGIGEAKAAAIIRYREEHGGFQKIEDLKEVEGIKEGVFNKVKDRIKI